MIDHWNCVLVDHRLGFTLVLFYIYQNINTIRYNWIGMLVIMWANNSIVAYVMCASIVFPFQHMEEKLEAHERGWLEYNEPLVVSHDKQHYFLRMPVGNGRGEIYRQAVMVSIQVIRDCKFLKFYLVILSCTLFSTWTFKLFGCYCVGLNLIFNQNKNAILYFRLHFHIPRF